MYCIKYYLKKNIALNKYLVLRDRLKFHNKGKIKLNSTVLSFGILKRKLTKNKYFTLNLKLSVFK
jgi:hypothetical protein